MPQRRDISVEVQGIRRRGYLLVLPAASSPSMSRRISLEPKSLPMIFETEPPILVLSLTEWGTLVADELRVMPAGLDETGI